MYKLYDSSKSVDSLFKSLYNKISLSNTYNEFIKYQKVTYSLIGKSDTVKRETIEKNSIQSKSINSYNNLLRLINNKNKYFQEEYFNTFLEEETLNTKQGKAFYINKAKEIIKNSTNPNIKQKFCILVNEINKSSYCIMSNKLKLNIKQHHK